MFFTFKKTNTMCFLSRQSSILVALFFSFHCFSQLRNISGKVSDAQTHEPLLGVDVFSTDKLSETVTDNNGYYSLQLAEGKHYLVASMIGLRNDTIAILVEGNTEHLDFELTSENYELDVVTVTGSKYEKKLSEEIISIEILKGSVIESSNSQLNDAVEKVPGVNMVGDNISIRGGSGFSDGANSRVGILLDDMPLLGGDDGGITWNAMPVEAVDQVEVLKGAGSALYGSASMNGVINVRTGNASGTEPQVKLSFNSGVYEKPAEKRYAWWYDSLHQKPFFVNGSVIYRQRFKWADVSVSTTYSQDGSYLLSDEQKFIRSYLKLKHSSKKDMGFRYGVNLLAYHFSGHEFFIWSDTGKKILFPQEEMLSYERNLSIAPFLLYSHHNTNHALRGKYYNRNSGTFNGSEFSNANQLYLDYTYNHLFPKPNLVFTTGFSEAYNFIKSQQYGNVHGSNCGIFVQADKKFFKRLTLSVGIRAEYNRADSIKTKSEIKWLSDLAGRADSNQITSPLVPVMRAGLNFQITKATNLRISYGQGFRYPSVVELFTNVVRSGIHVYPNPDLQPESGWTAEVGVKEGLKISKWIGYFDASAFIARYHNMTEFTLGLFGSPPSFGATSQNVEDAQISGFEITAFSQGSIAKMPLNFLAGYSFIQPLDLNVKQLYDSVQYLKYRNKSSIKLDIEGTEKKITIGISCIYNSPTMRIDPLIEAISSIYAYRALHTKGYVVLNAHVSYHFSPKFKIAFIAKNMLNTEYYLRPGKLEAPRNYTLQLMYEI